MRSPRRSSTQKPASSALRDTTATVERVYGDVNGLSGHPPQESHAW
eukprot:CAMPEP_0195083416 /NCGR_PEP_ID=MMETSP0448-20130528/24363_1 /TAXON_ID=66468 /ORGANISM="Heterocapsa triquestra, Strain CCMP 448" /LENGTH=45 /DNA_ID= /DNA_START= /DNA_END= /DNA_ORIENTATION=